MPTKQHHTADHGVVSVVASSGCRAASGHPAAVLLPAPCQSNSQDVRKHVPIQWLQLQPMPFIHLYIYCLGLDLYHDPKYTKSQVDALLQQD